MDTIIRRFHGVLPTPGQINHLHAAIDDDYGYREFYVVHDLWAQKVSETGTHTVPPFRPLPGMVGYADDVRELEGRDALQEVSTLPDLE
jgi:hypothetical protein